VCRTCRRWCRAVRGGARCLTRCVSAIITKKTEEARKEVRNPHTQYDGEHTVLHGKSVVLVERDNDEGVLAVDTRVSQERE
jgi:hypothetical protein